jgi:hypothetical protein
MSLNRAGAAAEEHGVHSVTVTEATGSVAAEARLGELSRSLIEQRERLAVASRLSAQLAPLLDVTEIARIAVLELHHSFDYYLAVIQRLDPDGMLRVVAAEGPLAEMIADFLALEQLGLAGEEIPLDARIVFACDALHAMTSDRPYRSALSGEEAFEELREGAGTQFDPSVIDALLDEIAADSFAAPRHS